MNPSSDWQQLLQLALLGTRHGGGAPVPALPELPAPPDASREAQVLRSAGALGLLHRAGYQSATATEAPPAAAGPETQPTLGPQGQDALRQLLGGHHAEVLPDYLRELARHGRRVPHRLLVSLLDHAHGRPELREATAAVLGERGRWLLGLNPAWAAQHAATAADDTAWDNGTPAQRRDYLLGLLPRDPTRARALLAAALPQEPARQQAVLLGTLAAQPEGLLAADAALLEPYLASKSKDVRQQAASLLVRVPGNSLVDRLWQHAAPLLTLKKPLLGAARLEVSLPEAWVPAWQANGIEPKDGRFSGEKAAWLGQLLALLPPTCWAAHFGQTPDRLLALAADGEWAALLLTAWRHALQLHRAADWARAYLVLQLERDDVPPLPTDALAELLSPAELTEILLAQLPRQPRLSQPEAHWEQLLLSLPAPWPAALTEQALRILDNTLTVPAAGQRYALHYRLTQLLRHMQLVVPPGQYARCAEVLSPLREVETNLHNPINQLLDTLYFRQQLAATLTEPPGADS
ncbi:DUF5691 domain-containing protein [Hymenobacter jeollabukensis]|uniref:Uncharacterized protein n=1 Tax=Hymenobacter jeollabukensis TaxID=2025313 RepID=A0A5R8WPW5_9BACT|nr:DUF5691 domain-containing protein [Hymenobacter jeollabukensis]TLM91751.1 hypothetical protein FDY95_14415 [Hymenobacter jeollabukensis]